MQSEIKRNHMADIVKGICSIFVVTTHFAWSDAERRFFLFPFWIDMAVPAFMIISGYANAVSFEKKRTDSLRKAYAPQNIADKFIRYTRPFAAVYCLEALLMIAKYGAGLESGWLTGWISGGFGPGSYYFPILVQLIFLFPLIYFLIRRYGHFGLLLCGVMNGCYEVWQYGLNMKESWYRLLVFRYLLLIAFGCYLYLGGKKRNPVIAFGGCAGCIFIILVKYAGYSPEILRYWSGTSFLAAMYIMPLMGKLLVSPVCASLRCGSLERLGRASYHIFLVQMMYYCFLSEPIYRIIKIRAAALVVDVCLCLFGGYLFYLAEGRFTANIKTQIRKYT